MKPQLWAEGDYFDDPDQDSKVAKIVSNNVVKTQLLVFTLHGEKSVDKKMLNKYKNKFNESELYTKSGTTVVIDGNINYSYMLEGLNRNTVVFKNKINHLMIRNSDDTRIYLNNGTISGIDILKNVNVSVRTPKHNFTNVEKSTYTRLGGTVDDNSLIFVSNSMDVFVNHKNLMVNPFSQSELKLVYKTSDNEERIDIGELSCSPNNRSNIYNMERPTKIHMKVKGIEK